VEGFNCVAKKLTFVCLFLSLLMNSVLFYFINIIQYFVLVGPLKLQVRLCHAVFVLICRDSVFLPVGVLRKYAQLFSYNVAIHELTPKFF
jgi:hypothetical protein